MLVNKPIKLIGCFALASLWWNCQQAKKSDTQVGGPTTTGVDTLPMTGANWLDTQFLDATGAAVTLKGGDLLNGGPSLPINMTYAQANQPLSLFNGQTGSSITPQGSQGVTSPVPYFAFTVESKSSLTVRYVKSITSAGVTQNIASELVVPVTCPDSVVKAVNVASGLDLYCLPLINQVIKGFLVPTDNAGAYQHTLTLTAKEDGKAAVALTTRLSTNLVIPQATLTIAASTDLQALPLSQRLTMASNDLVGSPRSDFKAFELKSSVAPGVNTSWLLTFTGLKMQMAEEVFFEQPVVLTSNPATPQVSRGGTFYKRTATIDSLSNFRLRIEDGYSAAHVYSITATNGNAAIEIPIADGTNPLHIYLEPDFGNPGATQSFSDYVKPFGPTFCPKVLAGFNAQEWVSSLATVGFEECDAQTRTTVLNKADAKKQGIVSPIETFFGSFSYMPRIGTSTLGGTNGVLTLTVSMTGSLTAAVRNPSDPTASTQIGTLDLGYAYQFPTAIAEMSALVNGGKGTPGMDLIVTGLQRKGVQDLPRKNGGKSPAFPFMGLNLDNIFY